MVAKLVSRKFLITAFFSVVVAAALFTKFLTGNEFLLGMGTILGLYGAANVMGKRE